MAPGAPAALSGSMVATEPGAFAMLGGPFGPGLGLLGAEFYEPRGDRRVGSPGGRHLTERENVQKGLVF